MKSASRQYRTSICAITTFAAFLSVGASAQDRALPPLPRSGSVDVPIAMTGIAPLPPMTLTVSDGPHQASMVRTGMFNGTAIHYRAELGEVLVKDADGSAVGNMFTTSYVATAKDGKANVSRPVLFAFNGGPGAASAFLHFTSLGPKRLTSLLVADMGKADNVLIDNPGSPLDAADIVIIDPIDTGFGRSVPGKGKRVHSIDTDSEMFTQVVINWLKSHGRMPSPKYIMGESYGTLRVVAMGRDLARSPEKIVVDGIIMAGTAFTFGANGRTPNPMFVASEAPMMASVAWHYGKIDNKGQTWAQAVDKARAFVRDHYAGALMQGNRLDPSTREAIIKALPAIIGIPESYFRNSGTISVADFNAELLRAEGRILDRNDGLQTRNVPPVSPTSGTTSNKSEKELFAEILKSYGALTAAAENLARNELKVKDLPTYQLLDPGAGDAGFWDLGIAGDSALDVTLAKLLNANPKMQLLVLQGRYDTLTDLGTTEYMLGQTNIAPSRYDTAFYEGGHSLKPEAEAINPLRALMRKQSAKH